MEQEHFKEWQRLQETALTTLRNGNYSQGIRLLYLLVMPSWEPSTNYEIYTTPAWHLSASHVVMATRWRGDIDAAKFDTPIERLKHPHTLTPTFETQSFETTTEFVDGILDKFTAISIPTLTNTDVWGLDGTSYEVGLGNGFVWSCFRWREEPPPEWQSLGILFHDTLHELEKTTTVKSRVDAG
jgi:hypothetical protein